MRFLVRNVANKGNIPVFRLVEKTFPFYVNRDREQNQQLYLKNLKTHAFYKFANIPPVRNLIYRQLMIPRKR